MIGKTLGRYRILEKIGRGGMGEVFLAEDTSLHRRVALKFLPPDMQQDEEAHKRFIREARSAAALDHPYICHINEVAESEGRGFIVMEYVDGQTLRAKIGKGPVALDETLRIGIEVVEALEAAHGKGIIHRDVKPENIMLTRTSHAKVMDFGLAKQMVSPEKEDLGGPTMTLLTSEGTTVGTLAYMSPEQLRGLPADARSDIWSLGVTLYEMASGVRPFQGQSGFEVSSAILNRAPLPLPAGVPAELGAVVGRCLEKDPAKRYQTAQDVRAALEAIRAGTASMWAAWRYRLARHRWLMPAAGALVVVALLFGLNPGGLRTLLTGRPDAERRAFKLAVLPFVNLTGDPEQEFLNDGLTQDIITLLGRLHPQSLGVIARTSVMRYKKAETPIDQIGRELDVDYVLEGSAKREGSRIRVSADLIQVRDQTQLWGDIFEREMSGILALQNEVAGNIAKALALKLLPSEQARLDKARPVNPEAYEACLKGMSYWYKLTPPDLDTAQRYFELALEKDPSYVPAHMGLSWVWAARQQMGIRRAREVGPEWKKAALRAVELDDNSSEGHLALAGFLTWGEWDWEAAWPEWRRAVELNPNNADALTWYSHFLANVGRIDEALPPIERALELDPFNPAYHSMYAGVLNYHRRYEEAVTEARLALTMQPDAPIALDQLTLALEGLGRKDERLAVQREWIARDPDRVAAFERGLAEGGYEGALRSDADVLAARYEQGTDRSGAVAIAILYRGAGDKDRSIDWLEKAFEDRDGNLPYIGRAIWAPLRSDPRFQDLLRRLKLPPGDEKSRGSV